MTALDTLRVKLFADTADLASLRTLARHPLIRGFTTNPTLMHKAGIQDYRAFAKEAIAVVPNRPISFEVFSDDLAEMERHAREIATWGDFVYVKIPVMNTKRQSTMALIHRLSHDGIQVNVTAVMTLFQVQACVKALAGGAWSYISVFAGRIADTGRDPVPHMRSAVCLLPSNGTIELIWASPRELFNVFQASEIGCHVITATPDILAKLALVGKDLTEYSHETVRMFYDDAQRAGYTLKI